MEPLSDGVEVASLSPHSTTTEPRARFHAQEGEEETGPRRRWDACLLNPAATQNIGFSSPSRGNRQDDRAAGVFAGVLSD